MCFDSVWTYERCCQTDFQDLICDLKRKGEEGGCVDCKKTVMYSCLTVPEKNLQDAQDNYNKEVDKYNQLQGEAAKLATEAHNTRVDLANKNQVYQEHYQDFNVKLHIWSDAFNNQSRLVSASR